MAGMQGKALRWGCAAILALILGCGGLLGGAWRAWGWWLGRSPVFAEAMALVEADDEAALALGLPVEAGWRRLGVVRQDEAWMEFPVRGVNARGTLAVEARRGEDGAWALTRADLTVGDREVDLLQTYAEQREREREAAVYAALERAEAEAGRGRLDEAVAAADEALDLDPDNPDAWFVRGKALYELDRLEEAEAALRRAIEADPDRREAVLRLGAIERRTGRLDACIATFTRLLRRDSDDARAWYERARCYRQAGDWRRAAAGAREACERGLPEACRMTGR